MPFSENTDPRDAVHLRNILLTGPPGIGKSTAIRTIAEKLGVGRAGGFWSGEIRSGGERVGFDITTLDGLNGVLAHTNQNEGPGVGRYRVCLRDIDSVAVPSMVRARKEGKVIIVDEIARMELFSESFRKEIIACLDTRRVVGAIQQRADPFLDAVRRRNDVLLVTLNRTNRNQVPEEVLSEI